MNSALLDYYRSPETSVRFSLPDPVSDRAAYFRWGGDTICYGRPASGIPAGDTSKDLYDVASHVTTQKGRVFLPFDPDEVINNLRVERYAAHLRRPGGLLHSITRQTYYALRPYLSVPIWKHLQRFRLRDWKTLLFPQWPVDCTVDRIRRGYSHLQ